MLGYEYVLAKIHGIHSKSIVGENFNKLKKIDSIERLGKELFNEDKFEISTKKLYTYIESRFKEKVYSQINDIAKYFEYKNSLINAIILKYEIENIKLIINNYYANEKNINNLFEVKLPGALDYKFIYSADISDYKNIEKIFLLSDFSFLLPLIENKKDKIFIENELDKFYYTNLLKSLSGFKKEQKEKIKKVIIEEMNWQNILWALRTKSYYNKTFDDVKDTFLKTDGLLSLNIIKNIYELEFIPNESDKIFLNFPKSAKKLIIECTNELGEIDIPKLESLVEKRIFNSYVQHFFIEFNILSIIAYIYIKMNEYNNVVKLVESLRYNMDLS